MMVIVSLSSNASKMLILKNIFPPKKIHITTNVMPEGSIICFENLFMI